MGPLLGDDDAEPDASRLSPLDRAQDLIYDAWEAPTRKKAVALARQALEICPDCADAYNLLGEESARDPTEACKLFRKGLQAAERALGPRPFAEDVGHFWGLLETRPYMRARANLAQVLWALDARDEAIAHLQEMLVLNPNDNQGNRYLLAAWLLDAGRTEDLRALLAQYEDDGFAGWEYTTALLAFRDQGDTDESRQRLVRALRSNPHVPAYLTGRKKVGPLPDGYSPGQDSEARVMARDYRRGWQETPGALDWLERVAADLGS
ncbi:MAG: hypothetical protein JXB32_12330 [Deltaproteobacteria bacterium]|nr:hypothetical protein [Deltaproteobacteria bacterium]